MKIEVLTFILFLFCLFLMQCKEVMSDSRSDNISADTLPSFPGAEGFGARTPGGRRGKIIEVTNLYPSGPGSFLAACEATDPRIIVFRTGGIIKVTRPITIKNPYVTIAGQTAPGDGICIQGADLVIATHDVIVRGLRVRVGDSPNGPDAESRDGIEIANENVPPYNVIVDHCSVSWAIDENMSSWYPCHDITFQWCITSEALDTSLHPKGPHSKGMIIGPGTDKISIHHNLFAHNVERNPLISVDTKSELINNVIYNWKSRGLNLGNCYPENGEKSDVIGNYFKKGPNSNTLPFEITDCWLNSKVFVKGNIGPGRITDSGDEWSLVRNYVGLQIKSSVSVIESLMKTIHPVSTAYDLVLDYSGAIIPKRDLIDTRIVNDVRNGTGKIIDSQAEVGGWPVYDAGIPPADTDHDGMPDEWEIAHGLNPNNFADRHNTNLSPEGYTNIEVYINGLFNSSH
jgi:pectate lyase